MTAVPPTRKRLRRPLERNIPPEVEQEIPECEYYKRLLESEKKIDAIILRKRSEIQEMINNPVKVRRTMRIIVTNYSNDQPYMRQGQPTWTLKIEGRMLGEKGPKLTHFIRQMIILVDNTQLVAEYIKGKAEADADVIQVTRAGDQSLNIQIRLYFEHSSDKYKVADELAQVLQLNSSRIDRMKTKREVVLALWNYIKFNSLFDGEDKRLVLCDDHLRQLFQVDKIYFPQIPDLITKFLNAPDPVEILYRVDMKQPVPYVVDVDLEVIDEENRKKLDSIYRATERSKEIEDLDANISMILMELNNKHQKRKFLNWFIRDPCDFVEKYVASQSRDLETITNAIKMNRNEVRNSEFYKQEWVKDAVQMYQRIH